MGVGRSARCAVHDKPSLNGPALTWGEITHPALPHPPMGGTMRIEVQNLVSRDRKTVATGDDYITVVLHDGTELHLSEIVWNEKRSALGIRILGGTGPITVTPRSSNMIWVIQEKRA